MIATMRRLVPWLADLWPTAVAVAAFAALMLGLWWERPSLALIVGGGFVFGCVCWTYARGGYG